MRCASLVQLGLLFVLIAGCKPNPYREVSVELENRQAGPQRDAGTPRVLRASVASMESPRDTYFDYSRLFDELGRRLGVEVSFVQRGAYRDVNALLEAGGLDLAMLCTGGYLSLERQAPGAVEVVAVPVVNGSQNYHSLVLVPAASPATKLSDLAGKSFALADELSLTGRGFIVQHLKSQGQVPGQYFGSTVGTGAHDRSIFLVARGLVEGAAVNSIIYEHQLAKDPGLAASTRIILRSPPYGNPPVVVSTRLSAETRAKLKAVFSGLADDPAGVEALRAIHVDRFIAPTPGLYQSASEVVENR